jgi:uncharacterized protein
MDDLIKQLSQLSKSQYKENKAFFKKIKKNPPKRLDNFVHEIHEEVFSEIDCLQCANCCKTTGPLFTTADIERIAKFLRLKPQQFIEQYLRVDEDNDHVLQRVPCAFLDADNYCLIYEVRPKACREYPHTDRKNFHQITNLTLKNTAICPAAYRIVEEMKKRLPK